MHARGEGRGCFVLYPGQDRQANRLGCWNWFEAAHQQRDTGEPSILADMIREIIAGHRIDPNRVYVAGLSAGGAMAAILATTHPELFAAVGIHSGLPHAAASNLVSALIAMKRGPARRRVRQAGEPGEPIPTIVFHGDQDATVHPRQRRGAHRAHALASPGADASRPPPRGRSAAWCRAGVPTRAPCTTTPGAAVDAEHWVIHGSGHAWSGGDPAGSYTDPLGPDASRRDAALLQGASAATAPSVPALQLGREPGLRLEPWCQAMSEPFRQRKVQCSSPSGLHRMAYLEWGSARQSAGAGLRARPHPLRPRFRFPRPGARTALPRRLPRRARPRRFGLAEEPDGVPGAGLRQRHGDADRAPGCGDRALGGHFARRPDRHDAGGVARFAGDEAGAERRRAGADGVRRSPASAPTSASGRRCRPSRRRRPTCAP